MFARLKLLMGLLHVLNLQTLNSCWRNFKFIFSVTLHCIITSRNKKLNFAGDRLRFYPTNSLESRSFLGLCSQDPHLDFALDPLGPHERRPRPPVYNMYNWCPSDFESCTYSQSVLNRIGLEFLYESGSLFYSVRNVKMTKGRKGQITTVLVFKYLLE